MRTKRFKRELTFICDCGKECELYHSVRDDGLFVKYFARCHSCEILHKVEIAYAVIYSKANFETEKTLITPLVWEKN